MGVNSRLKRWRATEDNSNSKFRFWRETFRRERSDDRCEKKKIELLLRGFEPPAKGLICSKGTTRASFPFNVKYTLKIYTSKFRQNIKKTL